VAAVLERVVFVGGDVADRDAELEQVGLVALERAQPGLDVERLVGRELLADLPIGHRRSRTEQDHDEVEQALAAIAARARILGLGRALPGFHGLFLPLGRLHDHGARSSARAYKSKAGATAPRTRDLRPRFRYDVRMSSDGDDPPSGKPPDGPPST